MFPPRCVFVPILQKGKVETPLTKGAKRPREDATQDRDENETKASKRSKTQVRGNRTVMYALRE